MNSRVFYPASSALFEIKGRDARDFLHRLTTANMREISNGDFQAAFLLNAQGKIRAAFRVAGLDTDSFLLEVHDTVDLIWKKELMKALDEMTFSERYELTEKVDYTNAWVFGLTGRKENTFERRENLFLCDEATSGYGETWTSAWGQRESVEAWVKEVAATPIEESALDYLRIRALHPKTGRELVIGANPLEIGMRSGIADNKGCYPGQEVIEKIISLGSPAKRLALLSGATSEKTPKDGDKVFTADGFEVGTLSSTTTIGGKFSGLAVLRKNVLETGKVLHAGSSLENSAEVMVERIAQYE